MPAVVQHLEARRYCGYYGGYYNNCNSGISYGARVGIGIAIAVVVVVLILLVGLMARRRRQRAINSMQPQFQTNQGAQTYQQQSYVPQAGYGYPAQGDTSGQQGWQNSGGYAGAGGQQGNAGTHYPPPQGPPPTDQPEMVDGQVYQPPSQPPPTYQK